MPLFNQKMKKNAKKGDSKKENNDRKYKKSSHTDSDDSNAHQSDSDNEGNGGNGGGGASAVDVRNQQNQQGEGEFDMYEYRKLLSDMFPSKYMTNRVNMTESNSKNRNPHNQGQGQLPEATSCKNEKKSTTAAAATNKGNENKKITRSMAKALQENKVAATVSKPIEKAKKKHSDNPPNLQSDNESDVSTSSTSTTCSDDDSRDDEYSSGFDEFAKEQLKNGKFNIVINLVNEKHKNNNNGPSHVTHIIILGFVLE